MEATPKIIKGPSSLANSDCPLSLTSSDQVPALSTKTMVSCARQVKDLTDPPVMGTEMFTQ